MEEKVKRLAKREACLAEPFGLVPGLDIPVELLMFGLTVVAPNVDNPSEARREFINYLDEKGYEFQLILSFNQFGLSRLPVLPKGIIAMNLKVTDLLVHGKHSEAWGAFVHYLSGTEFKTREQLIIEQANKRLQQCFGK
jgi:hypothetical protein